MRRSGGHNILLVAGEDTGMVDLLVVPWAAIARSKAARRSPMEAVLGGSVG